MTPKTLPVVEIFGPTLQGEGAHAGETAHFVRFGGCDFRCVWCDTPHAVLPAEVRANKQDLTALEVAERVHTLGPARWIVLTGGNPALHDLKELIKRLHCFGFKVALETQATRYKEWMLDIDSLCLSPKPPSSGMGLHWETLDHILKARRPSASLGDRVGFDTYLKVVIFTESDYKYTKDVHLVHPTVPMFLSTGNDAGRTVDNPTRQDTRTVEEVASDLLEGSRDLVEKVLGDPNFVNVTVQSQYHVLLWGNKQGV